MNGLKAAALASLLAGIGLLVYAAQQGGVRVSLLLIVPIVHGTGLAAAVGMLLLIVAGVLWFAGVAREMVPRPAAPDEPVLERMERRSGGVVLLGPIPIVWGSDRRILPWMVAAGAALLVLWIAAALLLGR